MFSSKLLCLRRILIIESTIFNNKHEVINTRPLTTVTSEKFINQSAAHRNQRIDHFSTCFQLSIQDLSRRSFPTEISIRCTKKSTNLAEISRPCSSRHVHFIKSAIQKTLIHKCTLPWSHISLKGNYSVWAYKPTR